MARCFAHAAFAGEDAAVEPAAEQGGVLKFGFGQNLRGRGAQIAAVDDEADAAEGIRPERRMSEPRVGAPMAGFVALGQGGQTGIEERGVEQAGNVQRKGGHGRKGKRRAAELMGPNPVRA